MPDTIKIKVNDKQTLCATHNRPPEKGLAEREQKLIIFMHDFPGHKAGNNDLYTNLAFILADKGFHSLYFDFLGCGESSGRQADFSLESARESLNAVKGWAQENDYKEFIFVSEGIGSTIAILNAEVNVTCQIMLWPGLDPKSLAETLFHAENIKEEWKKVGYIAQGDHHIGIPFINGLHKTNLTPSLRDMTMPVLIMHGSADDRYPVDHLNIARQAMPSKRIEITTFHNAKHGIPDITHRKSMFFHITQFLEKYA